jgi:hypothetical protein
MSNVKLSYCVVDAGSNLIQDNLRGMKLNGAEDRTLGTMRLRSNALLHAMASKSLIPLAQPALEDISYFRR